MTDEPKDQPPRLGSDAELHEGDAPLKEDDAMRALLKRSLTGATPAPNKSILREVQRKLRVRSKGKFYSDGWSTTALKINYGLIAVLMLLVVALAYFALGPTGFTNR